MFIANECEARFSSVGAKCAGRRARRVESRSKRAHFTPTEFVSSAPTHYKHLTPTELGIASEDARFTFGVFPR